MKITKFVTLVSLAAVLAFAGEGCKKKPQRTTPLPGQATLPPENGPGQSLPPIGPGPGPITSIEKPPTDVKIEIPGGGLRLPEKGIEGRSQDREKFKTFTVHFDFDRSVIRSSEAPKIDSVASQFKSMDAANDLLIEGHCDERGTEEYNRALGERRALAIREYLVRAGVNPEKVHTVSFGEDKPAALGHDESSWSQNRRGEFILVLPK